MLCCEQRSPPIGIFANCSSEFLNSNCYRLILFIELPMTSYITISNVTEKSVSVEWGLVEGATRYQLKLIDSEPKIIGVRDRDNML